MISKKIPLLIALLSLIISILPQRDDFLPAGGVTPIGGSGDIKPIPKPEFGNCSEAIAPYYDIYNSFPENTINTDYAVGSTLGSASVSGTGAANYSIPITMPMGTAGIQPKLAIAYSSQAGSGQVGMGWNLTGLSTITRTTKTVYHNVGAYPLQKTPTPITLTNKDVFTLDGGRLISTSGNYGNSGTAYATEVENYAQITSYGTLGNGPEWFKVTSKDGVTVEYGKTADARFIDPISGTVVFWRINKTYDIYGNYVEYIYDNSVTESRIKEIRYTGNTAQGIIPYNKISFCYGKRPTENTKYIGGVGINNNLLLYKIQTSTQNKLYREYILNYEGFNNPYLTQVIEYGRKGKRLNSTTFQRHSFPVDNYNPKVTEAIWTPVGGQQAEYRLGDYNGDGYTDLVSFYYYTVGGDDTKYFTDWELLLNDRSGGFTHLPMGEDFPDHFKPGNANEPWLRTAVRLAGFEAVDLNGDELDDIVMRTKYSGTYHYEIYYANGSGFTKASYEHLQNGDDHIFAMGDFNGHGITDFFSVKKHGLTEPLYKFYFSETETETDFISNYYPLGSTGSTVDFDFTYILPVDWNGDGKTELLAWKEGLPYMSVLEIEIISSVPRLREIYKEGFAPLYSEKQLGDFNGDGLIDIMQDMGAGWEMGVNKGNNALNFYGGGAGMLHPDLQGSASNYTHLILDADGDGKSDIFQYYHGSFYNNFKLLLSKGNGKFQQKTSSVSGISAASFFDQGDFNGDGALDIFTYNNGKVKIITFYETNQHHLLHKITDGLGNVTEFNYKPLTDNTVYSKGIGATFPVNDIQKPYNVVANVTTNNGIGSTRKISYTYSGAKIHRQGKGLLGFETTTNRTHNIYSVSVNELNTTYYTFLPKKNNKYLLPAGLGTPISLTTQSNTLESLGDKRFRVYTSATTSTNYLTGVTATQTFDYDAYGNLLQTINDNGVENSMTTNTYEMKGAWIPSRLKTSTSTITRSGETPYTTSVNITNNAQGQVWKTENFSGTAKKVITTLYRDGFGNVSQENVQSTASSTRITKYKYDTKGRYEIETTNTLGQTSSIEYHPVWSIPTKVTDIGGLITTHTYDNFGRLKTTTDYLGNTSNTNFKWTINNYSIASVKLPHHTIFSKEITGDGIPKKKTYYDKLERTVMSSTESAFGQEIRTTTKYDMRIKG